MNFKLDNEMKAGPLGLGEVAMDCTGAARHFADRGQILGYASGGASDRLPRGITADGYIVAAGGGGFGGASSVSGGACGSIGSRLGAISGVTACMSDEQMKSIKNINKPAAIQTIGQHIDQRITALLRQVETLQATRGKLDRIGALDLSAQTLRDALY